VMISRRPIKAVGQNPTKIDDQIDYFTTWMDPDNQKNWQFDSYYFMAYDLNSSPCDVSPQNDANLHFGLCGTKGETKDLRLKTCPARK
jgi:hypothetical protein